MAMTEQQARRETAYALAVYGHERGAIVKSRYIVTLNRDIVTTVGHLSVTGLIDGKETIIAPATSFTQTAGPRQFSTKKRALQFIAAQRAAHGHDVCSDVEMTA